MISLENNVAFPWHLPLSAYYPTEGNETITEQRRYRRISNAFGVSDLFSLPIDNAAETTTHFNNLGK
jgi:hypothetical protein